jgi:hypothetical protein
MVKKIIGLKVLILPLSIGFLLLFTILYIKPAYDSMAAAKKSIQADSQQLSDLQSKNQKLTQIRSKWETMEENKLIKVALPESNDIENYMSELYGRVSRSGALLGGFGTQSKASSGLFYLCPGSAGSVPATSSSKNDSGTAAAVAEDGAGGVPAPTEACASPVGIAISVTGSWDQLLGLFKYLEDTNRVANISGVSIGLAKKDNQDQAAGDLLSASISLNVFYKPKAESINSSVIGNLATAGQFNENSLKKIKGTIFSVYEEPSVSESGERNIFK